MRACRVSYVTVLAPIALVQSPQTHRLIKIQQSKPSVSCNSLDVPVKNMIIAFLMEDSFFFLTVAGQIMMFALPVALGLKGLVTGSSQLCAVVGAGCIFCIYRQLLIHQHLFNSTEWVSCVLNECVLRCGHDRACLCVSVYAQPH